MKVSTVVFTIVLTLLTVILENHAMTLVQAVHLIINKIFCMQLIILQFLLWALYKTVSGWCTSKVTIIHVILVLYSLRHHFIWAYTIADGEENIYLFLVQEMCR